MFYGAGGLLESKSFTIETGRTKNLLIIQFLPGLEALGTCSGYLQVTSGKPVASFAVYGNGNALSAIPPQVQR